jgi:predicted nuclease of restriction endonuclease-like RecB superfamily
MLPSNLLLVYKRKGEIQPRYAQLSAENLQVANQLIEFYTNHIGAQKKVLMAFVSELENQGYDYRFVRALALLLDRKSRFVCKSKVDPSDLRRRVFKATQKNGIPTTSTKRQQIIATIAFETSLPVEAVEEQLYADLEAELIVEKFEAPTAKELLQQYNLSLTQTLLFECSELTFRASGNWQKLFYVIKKLGLIYDVFQQTDFYVKIDGPSSLFKLTKRYGINIAKLLPTIITNQHWIIEAKILWKYTNEVCNFKMESTKHASLLRLPNFGQVTYDSAAEESFASQFRALDSGWILKREPEPILAANQVLIPDFSLEKSGLKIYLEIVGFWTEEYLQRKAEKLRHINTKMIIVVHEALACEKLISLEKRPQLHFIYYRDKIPIAPILQYLQKEFEEIKTKEIQTLKETPITFTEQVILYTEFANRTGFSVESVQTVLTTKPPIGYVPISNGLISTEKLQQISDILKDTLKQSQKLTLSQATTIIEAQGVNDTSTILDRLAYKIKWNGINSEQAEIIPPKPT